jgi:acetyltransferase-like isoleucine patch superfamily enzyme
VVNEPDRDHDPDIPASFLSLHALQLTRDTPWKASLEIRRILMQPLAWWTLRHLDIGAGWQCYGLPIIQKHRQSTVQIGEHMSLRSTVASNPLGPNHPVIISTRRAGAVLRIGDDFGMTGGSIVVDEQITIGHRVWVGANTIISDTDFHPIDSEARRKNPLNANTAPITIEDDVFIGMNVLILKGVTIGERSVIGAGSIVTRDVPPDTIVAGNPARIIQHAQ